MLALRKEDEQVVESCYADWDSPIYDEVDEVEVRNRNPTLLSHEFIPKYDACHAFDGCPKSDKYSLEVLL